MVKSKKKNNKTKNKSNIDYVVAIPTYKRYDEITTKTLPTLKSGKVDKKRIYVFVANKTEEKLYREKMDPDTYHKIVVGKKGLVPQRRYISQYFPEGTKIVSMDDDVQNMIQLKRDDSLKKIANLDTLFKRFFNALDKKGLYLWGVYPVKNNLFMKRKTTTDLRFVIGVVHGYINRHSKDLYPSMQSVSKEDIEQSILFYLKDGGVVRFNDITFTTKFNAPGGLGVDRFQMNKTAQEYLVKTYPNIAKARFRPDGTPEITLNRNPDI
tara:strand:- start:15 stop:815 length:801 start_codon:yes stop_codon:yes gene_type:complete